MDINQDKLISRLNRKKALVFVTYMKRNPKRIHVETDKFTGYQTFAWMRIKDKQNVHLDFQIASGKAKVFAVYKSQCVELSKSSLNQVITLPFSKGFIRLRLVGEVAKLILEVKKIKAS